LNTGTWFKRGKGASPEGAKYKRKEVGRESMAEAIRAYQIDPNYIKTVAPKTAARIREHVNANPRLNKVIHFKTNDDDYDALPSGAEFIDPEGNLRRKL